MLAIGAIIGGFISAAAYLPQILHLIKAKNSAGMSIPAWYLWLFSNLLLLAYAISIGDIPYIIVESMISTSNIVLIILTYFYKK